MKDVAPDNAAVLQKDYQGLKQGELAAVFDVLDSQCTLYQAESLPSLFCHFLKGKF